MYVRIKKQAGNDAKGEITYTSHSSKFYKGTVKMGGVEYNWESSNGFVTLTEK